jgi:hypothetical protein
MRGYEKYIDLPSVCLAVSSEDFQRILSSELMDPSPYPELSNAHVEILSHLTWEHCLKDAVTYVYELVQRS